MTTPLRKGSETLVSRNEHGEANSRIAGGTRFDGQDESHGHPLRALKSSRSSVGKAARGKKNPLGNALSDIIDDDGNILYND